MAFAFIPIGEQDCLLSRYSFEQTTIYPTLPHCQSHHDLIMPLRAYDTVHEISKDSASLENDKVDDWSNGELIFDDLKSFPSVKLPDEYYSHRPPTIYSYWPGYGIPEQVDRCYMSAGRNSANSLRSILGNNNRCLPIDFKVLLPDFIKGSFVSRSKKSDEELSHSIPDNLICAAQRHPSYSTVVNQCRISQEKVPVEEGGNKVDRDRNWGNRNLIETVSRRCEDANHPSAKPRAAGPQMNSKQHNHDYNNNNVVSFDASAELFRLEDILSWPKLGDRHKPPQVEEGGVEMRHTAENPKISNRRDKTSPTARKMSYAASVRQSANDVHFRRWLDSDFPPLQPRCPSASGGTKELAEEKRESSTRCAWKENHSSRILHPSSSRAVEPKSAPRQKIPIESAHSQSVPETGEECASNPRPLTPNASSARDSVAGSVEETTAEESLGIIRKSLNSSKSSGFEKVKSVRNRNRRVELDDPKHWSEDYKRQLLKWEFELPYKPKKKSLP